MIGREFALRLLERIDEAARRRRRRRASRLGRRADLRAVRSIPSSPTCSSTRSRTTSPTRACWSPRRKALHRIVASAIEELYADRLAEHYETIAYHAEQGEAWEQAFTYLAKSGDKALAAYAPAQAAEFYERALALIERGDVENDPTRVLPLHAGRGEAYYILSRFDDSAAAYLAMQSAANAMEDQAQEGVALFQAAISLHWAHRFEDAMAHAERAKEIGLQLENDAIVAGSLITIEGVYSVIGDQAAAAAVIEEASLAAGPLASAVAPGDHRRLGRLQPSLARRRGARARVLGERRAHRESARGADRVALDVVGQGARAHRHGALRRCAGLTRRAHRADHAPRRQGVSLPHPEHARVGVHRPLQLGSGHRPQSPRLGGRAIGDPEIIRNAELNLGDCYLARGELDEARKWLERVETESADEDLGRRLDEVALHAAPEREPRRPLARVRRGGEGPPVRRRMHRPGRGNAVEAQRHQGAAGARPGLVRARRNRGGDA